MKYALVFGLVLLVVWLWRSSSSRQKNSLGAHHDAAQKSAHRPGKQTPATEIVACAVCKVHLPRAEALTGKLGLYCSAAHRQQADH